MAKLILRRLALGLSIFLGIAGLLAAAIVFTRLGLPLRQTIVEHFLAQKLGQTAEIRGDVSVALGSTLSLAASDAFFASGGKHGVTADRRAFERVAFRAPYSLLLGQTSGISDFEISGISFDMSPASTDPGDRDRAPITTIVTRLLSNPFYENISFTDASFVYADPDNGWNENLLIEKLHVKTPTSGGASTLSVRARLNDTPVNLTGSVTKKLPPSSEKTAEISIEAKSPALSLSLSGVVDYSGYPALLEGHVAARSGSIADMLKSIGVASRIDAVADYNARLSGPLDAASQSDLEFILKTASGTELTVTGDVGSPELPQPVNITFSVDLGDLPFSNAKDTLALGVLGFSGALRGSLEQVELTDGKIRTSAAILELDEIGPISAKRLVKNADGTVGLIGLSILNGPRDAPSLSLDGEIGDLVDLRKIKLSGAYAFPTSALLNIERGSPERLGVLSGKVGLDDLDGTFGLKDLTGRVTQTNLFNLSYELSVPELRYIDELSYDVLFSVPDPTTFLAALGASPRTSLPAFGFEGGISLADSKVFLSGDMTSGNSGLAADLEITDPVAPGSWFLNGTVSSKLLDFSDLRGLTKLAKADVSFKAPDIEPVTDNKVSLQASIDLLIQEIVSKGKSAGNVKGKLKYDDAQLSLSPLSLSYLGGTINGDFGADLSKQPVRLSANGRAEKFQFGRLLKELGLETGFNSTAYLCFDVSGSGSSARQFGKSASGKMTGSLWGGVFPNRLLDLSGLNLVTWFATGGGSKTSKLVCAVLPFHFKNGVATTKSLILETEDVQVIGSGSVNLKSETLALDFMPRPKRKQLVDIVSPFKLDGPMGHPKLTVRDAGAGRAVGEVLSMPLSLVGRVFHGSGLIDTDAKPCVLPKNSGPK